MIIETINNYAKSNEWFSETGLMRLHPYPNDSIILPENGKESVDNENGILFLIYFWLCALLLKHNPTSEQMLKINQTIDSLLVKFNHGAIVFGLFNRQPVGRSLRYEAHDNYAAIISFSVLFKDLNTFPINWANAIIGFGHVTGYNYNNVDPYKFKLEQQRQGSEIAFYNLCAGYRPELINLIWLFGAFLVRLFGKRDSSSWLLSWLRINALCRIKTSSTTLKFLIGSLRFLWLYRFKKVWGNFNNLTKTYFNERTHPINVLSFYIGANVVLDQES